MKLYLLSGVPTVLSYVRRTMWNVNQVGKSCISDFFILSPIRTDQTSLKSKLFIKLYICIQNICRFYSPSQCVACSQMTSWVKQLNLQLFKKQEYDSLLCHLHTLTLEDIYRNLKTDFHWDMFIREVIMGLRILFSKFRFM